MRTVKPVLGWLLAVCAALGLALFSMLLTNSRSVHAAAPLPWPTPAGPDRYGATQVEITVYEWWLVAWANNGVRCAFWTDHIGLPNGAEVSSACGEDLYNEWKAYSTPCDAENTAACPGYYFILVGSKPETRDVTVKLPPPQIWVSVERCTPDEENWCTTPPILVLTAEEPLPNETILNIEGYAGEDPFQCQGHRCTFKLTETSTEGVRLNFWANSTYGDSSRIFEALLRVVQEGGEGERLTKRWYVDVLSTQWIGAPLASCSAAWESFPPEGLPQWLTTPEAAEDLRSNIPYAYLAANLISQGIVDGSPCPQDGLLPDGSANACGMEAAKPAVLEWQNRFDQLIFSVAQETQVPAQLLKNLFSRESQFWPGIFSNLKDVGLGQLTSNGADTALLWNPSFYGQFCPLVLDQSLCETTGFANLKPAHQELLRGALVASVDARCADCPLGLDLSRADFSVNVFARTLLANCEQAGTVVRNVTGKSPGLVADYETLWRLTLINYNAGSGCLAEAVTEAYQSGNEPPLGWEATSAALDEACRAAVDYVEDISRDMEPAQASP